MKASREVATILWISSTCYLRLALRQEIPFGMEYYEPSDRFRIQQLWQNLEQSNMIRMCIILDKRSTTRIRDVILKIPP